MRNTQDFHGQVLYHGSPTAIPVGEIIKPKKGEAFATPDKEKAKTFAEGMFSRGSGKGTVHVVEPLEGDETLVSSSKKPNELRSLKGFRVVAHDES